ncbi:MAG: aminotransferase class I/II-fold pyridoxal phosphate-dependent enzyme [Bacteroidota bacterium]
MILSRLAQNLPGSEILQISGAIKERIATGETIFNGTVGDFDPHIFPIPHTLELGIVEAYRQNHTNYPAAEGIRELRESICAFTEHFQGIHYTPAEVLVGSGGRPLIYCAFKAIVDPGDRVVFPTPSWNNPYYVAMTGGIAVEISTKPEDHFMPTAENIIPHLKDATLLCLCSPLNPSGTVFSKKELSKICEAVLTENFSRPGKRKKLYVLYDQMYSLLTYGETRHLDPVSLYPEMKDYTIYIDAISKSFAATGVRVGWCLGPEFLLSKMKAILTHLGAWAPMAEQKAVAGYLTKTNEVKSFLRIFKTSLFDRLMEIYQGIQQLKAKGLPVDAIRPQAAIYLSVYIGLPTDQLLDSGIGLLPFSTFGAQEQTGWYRLSVGTCRSEDIPAILRRIEHAFTKQAIL